MNMLEQIVKGPSPSPRTRRDDISYTMEAIVLKAMANRTGERFQSMEQFQQALEEFLKIAKTETDSAQAMP